MQEQIYGRRARPPRTTSTPPRASTRGTRRWEFNVDKANQILDAAGWKRGADGIRAKDGKRLKFLYQTSTNAPRQKTQAIVKQAAAKAGIEIEIKSVVASVFFSSDAANPDTYPHFYADLQMYNDETGAGPALVHAACSPPGRWPARPISGTGATSPGGATKSTTGSTRPPETEMDPVKRAAHLHQDERPRHPECGGDPRALAQRRRGGRVAKLRGMDLSGWDTNVWRLPYWYKEA